MTEFPSRRTVQIDVFCKNFSEARKLKQLYAGKIHALKKASWLLSQKRNFCLPLQPYLCIASEKTSIPQKYQKLIPIVIPAGLAFGTGEHATTSLCLRQLVKLFPRHCVYRATRVAKHCFSHVVIASGWRREGGNLPAGKGENKNYILDVGTGSGILALAAATLGYRVVAIDNDISSIREAKANALRNPHIPDVAWKISSVEKFLSAKKFDAIVANLYAEILVSAMPRFKKLLKPHGKLVLSGILKNQAGDVISAIHSSKLKLLKKLHQGKWMCLVMQK